MIVCIPVDEEGLVGPHWGRAARVAVARVESGGVESWEEYDVGWDVAHDEGTHDAHHARIARFLRDHGVEAVVAGGVGPGMVRMLSSMGIELWYGASGPARQAVLAVLEPDNEPSPSPAGHADES